MTLLGFITGAALVAALVAWRQSRRTARRLEQLSQMYWELKFQHGELLVRVRRLSGESAAPEPAAMPSPQAEAFVPLTSLKR
jgi:hypothetical protein